MLHGRIKWGILGTSFISEVMAKAIKASESSELAAIGSRSLATAKAFADQFSIPHYYDDYQSLLQDPSIDAIYIGLPNQLHKEWIIRAARAGKHILCEKPLVISVSEAHEVISTIQQTSVFCMEALMYRCHPLTKKLQEIIQSRVLGDITLYTATYTANIADIANPVAGGSIRNLGCYPISLIRLLANQEPVEIHAMGRLNPKNQMDHQGNVMLKFADNTIAMVSAADDIDMFWAFDVYGTKGRLQCVTNPWLPEHESTFRIYSHHDKAPEEIKVVAEKPLYTYQIDTVNANILNRSEQDGISLIDSLGNTVVVEEWLRQVRQNCLKPMSIDVN